MEIVKKKITVAELERIKLIIPISSYRKIMAYATICDTEISGFADIEYSQERNCLLVGEVYLLEQTAGGTDTHMDEDSVHKFNETMIRKGVQQLPRLWWHSHVNMEAFFSGTDEATTDYLQNETFNVSLVVNKRKDMKAMMYYKKTATIPMIGEETQEYVKIDPLQVTVELDYERIPEALKREVEKKVKARSIIQQFLPNNRKWSTNAKRVLFLPKNPEDAKARVDKLGLVRTYSFENKEWTYVDITTQEVWVDRWGAIEESEDQYYGD